MLKNGIVKYLIKNIIVIAVLIPLVFYCNKTFATTTMTLSANFSDTNIKAGEESVINISIDKLESTGEGVNAYIFLLEFNTEEFEFIKVDGQNGWNTPTYNEANVKAGNGKFTATRASFTKETGSIAKITLKAKKDFNQSNMPTIKIGNISFATKIDNKIQKVELKDINISLIGGEQQQSEVPGKIDNAGQKNETTQTGNDGNGSTINKENDKPTTTDKETNQKSSDNNLNEDNSKKVSKTDMTNDSKNSTTTDNKSTTTIPNAGLESQLWLLVFALLLMNVMIIYYKYQKIYKYI